MEVPSFLGSKQVEEVDRGTHMLKSSTLNRQFPFLLKEKLQLVFFSNLFRIKIAYLRHSCYYRNLPKSIDVIFGIRGALMSHSVGKGGEIIRQLTAIVNLKWHTLALRFV